MPTLFVSNLPPETTPAELEKIFSRHGQVVQAQVAVSQKTGQIQNFGVVEMSESDAQWACETLHRSWYKNNCIEVQYSRAPFVSSRASKEREQTRDRGQDRSRDNRGNDPRLKSREVYLVSGF
ncbi:MAG: RNA recognition motif domain-containing protein [Candidatus Sericytochromatia bacterium]